MNPLAALARALQRPRDAPFRGLTREQKATLRALDAAIIAQPDRPIPHFNRARFLDFCGAEFALVLEAVRPGVRLDIGNRNDWINDCVLLKMSREDWDDWVHGRNREEANYWLAYAVASFEVALQRALDLTDWPASRPPDWDGLAVLQRADKLELARDEAALPQSPDELKILALAVAITGDDYVYGSRDQIRRTADWTAAQIYGRAIRLQFGAYKRRGADYLPVARNGRIPRYRQLAWWNFIIELSPDDARLRRESARWLSLRGFWAEARRDIARAIELAPDDATLYETRAKISPLHQWWDLAPQSNSKTADYLRAIELRIAAGQIDGTPAKLRAQGDQLSPAIARMRGHSQARARAFYTLAIAKAPNDATLYQARARAVDIYADPFADTDEIYAVAYRDYVRALALDSSLAEARAPVVQYLAETLARPTAHERMEALLEARQELVQGGVAASLATAIVGEVEAALSARL